MGRRRDAHRRELRPLALPPVRGGARDRPRRPSSAILRLDARLEPEEACGAAPINGLLEVARRRGARRPSWSTCATPATPRAGAIASSATRPSRSMSAPWLSGVDGAILRRRSRARRSTSAWACARRRAARRGLAAARRRRPSSRCASAGELRGCIGSVDARRAAGRGRRAQRARRGVPRPALPAARRATSCAALEVEVSLLSPRRPLRGGERGGGRWRSLRPGIDGVCLEFGDARATFLPQVWESIPDPLEFLVRAAPQGRAAAALLASGAASSRATRWRNSAMNDRVPETHRGRAAPGALVAPPRRRAHPVRPLPARLPLHEGQRGACFVRARVNDAMVLTTYGRSSGFCIDPVEKKPLNHFLPGSAILSFGTAGCNLACKFCQNWDISKSRDMDRLMDEASPRRHRASGACSRDAAAWRSPTTIPVIFAEYAMDVADACREAGHPHRRGDRGLHQPRAAARVLREDGRGQRGPEGLHRRVLREAHRREAGSRARHAGLPQARDRRVVRDHDAADSRARTTRPRRCAPSRSGS